MKKNYIREFRNDFNFSSRKKYLINRKLFTMRNKMKNKNQGYNF